MTATPPAGLVTATAAGPASLAARGRPEPGGGTPEQVHLTWGEDPARSVVVSWSSPGRADRPRVRIGQRVIPAAERAYTDPANGKVTWYYHARVGELRPGATYGYAVTADNDAAAADPFSATFTTAPAGRAAFRFTSFGDLSAPGPGLAGLAARAAYAVGAVETFQPLFHLLGSDLSDAGGRPGGLIPADRAKARQAAASSLQPSTAYRPWLPVPAAGARLESFLTSYTLPSNGAGELEGRWYAFRVGTACFITLSGEDVAYEAPPGGGRDFPGDGRDFPADGQGFPGGGRGFSGGAQTRWLETTLAAARRDASVDWIVVQLHACACDSGPGGLCDLGVRREWLPLFDTYEVDLVLAGHGHAYERSFPLRGADGPTGTDADGEVTDTCRPHPVTTADGGVFDTSQGTVHLVLGSGAALPAAAGPVATGSVAPAGPDTGYRVPRPAVPAESAAAELGSAERGSAERGSAEPGPAGAGLGTLPRMARVLTGPGQPASAGRHIAVETATWSARRDASTGYGIAVFDVNPGTEAGGQTSVSVRYYHATGTEPTGPAQGPGSGDYTLFEAFTLVRPRSDGRRWHPRG